jgi:hypothetical protein
MDELQGTGKAPAGVGGEPLRAQILAEGVTRHRQRVDP